MKHAHRITFALVCALSSLIPGYGIQAGEGSGHSGGGGNEIYFHSLATQIDDWLRKYEADGTLAQKLELESVGLSTNDLVVGYEGAMNSTPDVKFIPQDELRSSCQMGDAGACLLLQNPSRICVNHGHASKRADGKNYIRCNSNLFDSASGDLQFSITFHEYLGVAGIEKNGTSDIRSYSQYPVSKHLVRYALPKTVIRYELGDHERVQLPPTLDGAIEVTNSSPFWPFIRGWMSSCEAPAPGVSASPNIAYVTFNCLENGCIVADTSNIQRLGPEEPTLPLWISEFKKGESKAYFQCGPEIVTYGPHLEVDLQCRVHFGIPKEQIVTWSALHPNACLGSKR